MSHQIQMNERGQITIPKELREKMNLKPQENLKIELDGTGKVILYKADFFDDLEDLIKRDLLQEGYSSDQFSSKIPERKKELAKALLKMSEEANQEIDKGEYFTLEQLHEELEKGE